LRDAILTARFARRADHRNRVAASMRVSAAVRDALASLEKEGC